MDAKRIVRQLRSLAPPAVRERVGRFLTADLGEISFPSISLSLRTLRDLNFTPGFCVDVGAYRGDWTQLFKSIFPGARVLMIEAQDQKREELMDVARQYGGDVYYENALLGPEAGRLVDFHEMETGSSVLAETSHFSRVTVKKRTQTLDSIVSGQKYPKVDMLKLDVQGYELEVLKGASETIAQAEAVLLEVSLLSVNAGCPLFSEVVAFMDQRGFRVFDFCSQIRRRDGVLWQTDLLFLRAGSRFAPTPELTPKNWG
jgi:FkbM family methyltransferase